MTTPGATFENRVRDHRQRRGWSQDELARRSGLSRPEVSAIETGRVVPSTAAALALALALAVRVEDLFRLAGGPEPGGPDQGGWAWPPSSRPGRFWRAEVGGRIRLYPVEVSPLGLPPHDGAWVETGPRLTSWSDPSETLVMACCDPAANVLAAELARTSRVRLLVLPRSSQAALELLRRGLVHVAGLHLARADAADGHAALARERLGGDARLERVARWEDGLAFAPGSAIGSARQALAPRRRWVGREAGSGARSCQDEVWDARQPPRRVATDHWGVVEALRRGWADVGVCLRPVAEEAGLGFLGVREEAYDLCYLAPLADDPRIQALLRVIHSGDYRRLLDDLPGCRAAT